MIYGLNWAYDRASRAIPGLGSAEDIAESHLSSCGGSREKAIDNLIVWQVSKAGTVFLAAWSGYASRAEAQTEAVRYAGERGI
jgi:hypothetical protein